MGAREGGPRGVNLRRSWSGDWTTKGRRTEPANVMIEKTTRDSEPTRPTSPRVSFDAEALVSVRAMGLVYHFTITIRSQGLSVELETALETCFVLEQSAH